MEEEKVLQETRAIELFVEAQEKKKQMAQEEQRREEAHKDLLAGVAKGEELFKQLCEQADAHEEEMKKSAGEQLKVGISKKSVYISMSDLVEF